MNATVVIGAGVVGLSVALALQAQGRPVRVIDRKGVAAEASAANAGAFAFADIEPLATPGIMRRAPKWLLDPLGPLSIPAGYALPIAPWMWRFWRASRPARYAAAVEAQARLMDVSRAALDRLIADLDAEALIQRDGQLSLYEGEDDFAAAQPAWALRRRHGVAFTLLDRAEAIAEIQPGLAPRFTHAGYTPDWINTVDPKRWTERIAQTVRQRGGTIETADVVALQPNADGVALVTPDGAQSAEQVVVAAGAWSHHLARTVGDRIPLETERGYNTTL
ncbi:MAG: FAD-dependent oxidoreductase, partial [Pseudomonadota bacterium]